MYDQLFDPACKKFVLILDPMSPTIGSLRWRDLADRMDAANADEPRRVQDPSELREVPGALFVSIFSSLVEQPGLQIALSCLHQTSGRQTMVVTKDRFREVVEGMLTTTKQTVNLLRSELNVALELQSALQVSSLS